MSERERDQHDPCEDCEGGCDGCAHYEGQDDDYDDPPLCGVCFGSGEGMHNGTRCTHCGGSGVERSKA
jgi:hypothetical protein